MNAPLSASTADNASHEEAQQRMKICDFEFMCAVRRLRRLSAFVMQVSTQFEVEVQKAARLGALNQLEEVFRFKDGRRASLSEWREVEERTQVIWAALTEAHRRRFLASEIPAWFSYLTSALLGVAAASLLLAYLIRTNEIPAPPGYLLGPFMIWIMSLGAIGACASIGMNALSVQDDATYDISSSKFLWLRLLLGALFGTVLTLPLGFAGFQDFLTTLQMGPNTSAAEFDAAQAAKQAGLLLLPFILGFSTSLVILVLTRLIESAQTFFGKPVGQR